MKVVKPETSPAMDKPVKIPFFNMQWQRLSAFTPFGWGFLNDRQGHINILFVQIFPFAFKFIWKWTAGQKRRNEILKQRAREKYNQMAKKKVYNAAGK